LNTKPIIHDKTMKIFILGTLALVTSLSLVPPAPAQTYKIPWHKVAGGGGTGAGGIYAVRGTAGQWDAGNMNGGSLSLAGGFWVLPGAPFGVTAQYTVVALDAPDDGSEAYAVNNAGQIVGAAFGVDRAVFWTNSSSQVVTLQTPATSSRALGINDSGQVVGTRVFNGSSHAMFWPDSGGGGIDLGTFGPPIYPLLNSGAFGINSAGKIVGASEQGNEGGPQYFAAFWASSFDSPSRLNGYLGNSYAINDSGQIAGSVFDTRRHAAIWPCYYCQPSELIDAADSPGSEAIGINASGQIVGYSTIAGERRAVFWSNSLSAPVVLGSLGVPGNLHDTAHSINASGEVVGWCNTDGGYRAVQWQDSSSQPIDLNTVLPTNSGWVLNQAYGINNAGEIVGSGTLNGVTHAFALLPLQASNAPPTTVAKIAAGIRHSLFLGPGGSLWAMGMNESGCLGDGTTAEHDTPEQILPNGVTAVAAGIWHSLFLKSDGSLWGMGHNGYGQLGDGTTVSRATPVQIASSGVTAIGAGFHGSLFLKSDGSLWAMGLNDWGQLGDGTTTDAHVPEQIVPNGVAAIAVGFLHTLFLKSDGSLWGMGNSSYEGSGALGDGTSTSSPKQIVSSNVTAIAAGYVYSLFVKSDGSLWAMGNNRFGQLGDGTTNNASAPEQIVSSGVTAVAADGSDVSHSLFLKSDGSLWGMGCNGYGQLGDGTTNDSRVPKQIVCSGVTGFAAGYAHTLFVKSDGSLWGMGYNYGGQLGDGTTIDRHTPERIVGSGPALALLITAVARVGYTLQLSFVSDACHSYNVLTTTDLAAGTWSTILTGVPGNGGIVQVTIPNGFDQPRQFFRIQQAP
jgi:alpha-tubulin suppressor-like RCC1 family protein/uncharacterized membrane protein